MATSIAVQTGELANLQRALNGYMRYTRKTAEEAARAQAAKIILGNQAGGQRGLWQELGTLAPAEGQVSRERLAAFDANRGTAVRPRALAKADKALAGRKAGLFLKSVEANGRQRLTAVRFGKRNPQKRVRSGGVFVEAAGTTAGAGEVVLNRRALAAYMELSIREAGRGVMGIAFLAKRYRRLVLSRPAGQVTAGGQVKGVASPDLPSQSSYARQQVTNRTGTVLSEVEIKSDGNETTVAIRGAVPGLDRRRAPEAIRRVLAWVAADIDIYLARKAPTSIVT